MDSNENSEILTSLSTNLGDIHACIVDKTSYVDLSKVLKYNESGFSCLNKCSFSKLIIYMKKLLDSDWLKEGCSFRVT